MALVTSSDAQTNTEPPPVPPPPTPGCPNRGGGMPCVPGAAAGRGMPDTIKAEMSVSCIAMYGQTVRGKTSFLVRVWAIAEAERGKWEMPYLPDRRDLADLLGSPYPRNARIPNPRRPPPTSDPHSSQDL